MFFCVIYYLLQEQVSQNSENAPISGIEIENYWLTLIYLSVTAIAILIFSLGYYCIEVLLCTFKIYFLYM